MKLSSHETIGVIALIIFLIALWGPDFIGRTIAEIANAYHAAIR